MIGAKIGPERERHALEPGLQRLDVDLAVGPEVRAKRAQPDADAAPTIILSTGVQIVSAFHGARPATTPTSAPTIAHATYAKPPRPAEPEEPVTDARTNDRSLDEPNDDAHGTAPPLQSILVL